ncbi:MAG: EF2563 family selenium-dependent molybdenum hydroxylase system protein [Clostridiales bacterium]|nr:EF2563 family selenium-dependent molybdenum hydroxylase system protein [Clostridiales bacterium]
MREIVVIRGAGDIASGVGYRLKKSGFRVIMLEIDKPTVVRRTVSFASAIYKGETMVEDMKAIKVDTAKEALEISKENLIPVLVDKEGKSIEVIKPTAVVDCILAKKNLGTNINMAPAVIGVGPGFQAGVDVHAVVETKRGHDLGRVIWNGSAAPDTGIPGDIEGYSSERLIRATSEGRLKIIKDIGQIVKKGERLCEIDGEYVIAAIDGLLRGMIMDGSWVYKGMKIGDIDPRGNEVNCYTISDRARAVGGGVLEALLSILDRSVI